MRRRGFTLAECMIAIVFIAIAFFGYVGLHERLILSAGKLQLHQLHSEHAGQMLTGQIINLDSQPFPTTVVVSGAPPGLVSTSYEEDWTDPRTGSEKFVVDTYLSELDHGW